MRIRSTQLKLLKNQFTGKQYTVKPRSPLSGIYYMPKLKGEDEIANRIAIELKVLHQMKRLNCVFTHPRNEASNYVGLPKAKCLGMIPGAPDYFFISKDAHLLVEVKTSTGIMSEHQKTFMRWCESVGVTYIVVRSWDELKGKLEDFGMISRETIQ